MRQEHESKKRHKEDRMDERRGFMKKDHKFSDKEESYIKAKGRGSCGDLDSDTRPMRGHKIVY